MAGAKHTPPTAGPWEYDPHFQEVTTDRREQPPCTARAIYGVPAKWMLADTSSHWSLDTEQVDADGRLLSASPDFLAACTRERDTVPALDWLSSILTVVDGRFSALAGDDPQALHTALQASSALLAELRAAVARTEGGGDE